MFRRRVVRQATWAGSACCIAGLGPRFCPGGPTRATNSCSGPDGYRVTYLPVDRNGLLKLADLEAAITDQAAVVSLMWANNETGVLFPVAQIAAEAREPCRHNFASGSIAIRTRKPRQNPL